VVAVSDGFGLSGLAGVSAGALKAGSNSEEAASDNQKDGK
jgi:hypothetical protein